MRNVKTTILFSLLLAALSASAQSLRPHENDKGRWGYVDAQGNVVIKCQWDQADNFEGDRARVEKDGKIGFVGVNGKPIVPLKYSVFDPEDTDVFRVAIGGSMKDGELQGAKWTFTDKDGKQLMKAQYDGIGEFLDGYAWVKKGSKYGFIDRNFKECVKPAYEFVGLFNKQGLAWVNKGGKDKAGTGKVDGGKYGVIDRAGKEIIKPAYKSLGVYPIARDTMSFAAVDKAKDPLTRIAAESGMHLCVWPTVVGGKTFSQMPECEGFAIEDKISLVKYGGTIMVNNGVADMSGKVLIRPGKFARIAFPQEGIAVVWTQKKNKLGYVELAGKQKLADTEPLTSAFSFNNGYAVVIDVNGKWRFINKELDFGAEKYDWISPQIDGNYLVRLGDKMQVLDAQKLAVRLEAKYIYPESEGLMACCTADGKWNYLDAKTLQPVGKATYDYALSMRYGHAIVKQGDKWGLIDNKQKSVLAPKWAAIQPLTTEGQTYVWAQNTTDSLWVCLNTATDKPAFKGAYSVAENFADSPMGTTAMVQNNGTFGVVNTTGQLIVPLEMKTKELASGALLYMKLRHIDVMKPVHAYRYAIYQNPDTYKQTLKGTIANNLWDY